MKANYREISTVKCQAFVYKVSMACDPNVYGRRSYGSIGRVLKINPQSVADWVSAYTAKLPKAARQESLIYFFIFLYAFSNSGLNLLDIRFQIFLIC